MNEKDRLAEDLRKKAARGSSIKTMMDTPGFKEVYLPWIEKTLKNYETNGLVKVNVMTDKETHIFAGEYRGARLVNNFFTRAIREGERASERLKEIEDGK